MATESGILWVGSRIVDESLSVDEWDRWYEDEHALEVLALPGIPSATRYTLLPGCSEHADPAATTTTSSSSPYPHLITYALPSLAYVSSPAFTDLTTAPPSPDLVTKIYNRAAFDIRIYRALDVQVGPPTSTSTSISTWTSSQPQTKTETEIASQPNTNTNTNTNKVLACITLTPPSSQTQTQTQPQPHQFEQFIKTTLPTSLSALTSLSLPLLSVRCYKLVSSVLRDRNETSLPKRPEFMVLVAFEGLDGRGREVVERVVREGMGEGEGEGEVGWYGVKRVWG